MIYETQIEALDRIAGQVVRTSQLDTELDEAHYTDRIAQTRVCLYSALNELQCLPSETIELDGVSAPNPEYDDAIQFVEEVIREQRVILDGLVRGVGGCPTILPPPIDPPDTIPAPHDTLKCPVFDDFV